MTEPQVYTFWYCGAVLTSEIATSEAEARAKATANAHITCDRPNETPFERQRRLQFSDVTTYPLWVIAVKDVN